MSNADWLDRDEPPTPPAFQPLPQAPQFLPVAPALNNPQPPANVVLYVAVVALAIALGWSLCFRDSGGKDKEDSNVSVNSVHVMIIEESADRDKLTPEQLAVFNSVKIRKELVSRKGEMRVFDVHDDFETIGDPWQSLKRSATLAAPYVIIAKNRKAIEFKLKDVDSVLEKIESVDGGKK